MTDLINQITINGETNTFYNYVNPAIKLELQVGAIWGVTDIVFGAQFGNDANIWVAPVGAFVEVRFPVPWETLTGTLVYSGSTETMGSTTRFKIQASSGSNFNRIWINTTNAASGSTNRINPYTIPKSTLSTYLYPIAIANDYAYCEARFNANATACHWWYVGWSKDATYSGNQFPRSAVAIFSSSFINARRPTQENTSTQTTLLSQNPTLSCQVATPGSDSTDVIIQDSTAPNNYIGKLWNMMILPSTAVVGKIYKNTGIDPDTGAIETDQKAFWICVGDWGTDKIGMRVWTENIT